MKSSVSEKVRTEIKQILSQKGAKDLSDESIAEAFAGDDEKGERYTSYTKELRDCSELYIEDVWNFKLNEKAESEERKCRVCGCTQNDCRQCIEKTGEPCHWVEDDLCSACVEEKTTTTNETLPIVEVETENEPVEVEEKPEPVTDAYEKHVQNVLNPSPITFTEMKFFSQLHTAGQSVHLSLDIMEKNGKYTVMLLPKASDGSKLQPIIVTGTPDELDNDFFKKVGPVLLDTSTQLINAEAHKKSVADVVKKSPPVKQADKNPPAKKEASKKPAGKQKPALAKQEEAKPKVEEQKLF